MRQVKQLRWGIKETQMWTLVTQRPHKVALLFPKDTVGIVSTEVHLNYSFLVTSLLKEILRFIPGQHLLLSAVQSKFFSRIFFFFPMQVQCITWPQKDDSDDDYCCNETEGRIQGYLRQFTDEGRVTSFKCWTNHLFNVNYLCHSWISILWTNCHLFESTS